MTPEELLEHQAFVRNVARSLVSDQNSVADITQQAWLAALEHPPASRSALRGWLRNVTRNFALRLLRGEARRAARERAAAIPEGIPSTEEIVALEESRRHVVEAVLGLAEPYRSAILLRYYHDLPAVEVALRLDVPIETTRSRIKRGLARLRQQLDGEFGDRTAWILALAPLAGVKVAVSASVATAGAATGVGAGLAGGFVMATKLTIGIVAILLIGAMLVVWHTLYEEYEPSREQQISARAVSIETTASGATSAASDADVFEEAARLRTPLHAAAQIFGVVLDSGTSRPLDDASVLLRSSDAGSETLRTKTDAAGRFCIDVSARSGSTWLVVRCRGYWEQVSKIVLSNEMPREERSILLEPQWRLEGMVVDSQDHPVPGARVTAVRLHSFTDRSRTGRERTEWTAIAGADGRFVLSSTSGPGDLGSLLPEYVRGDKGGEVSTWQECIASQYLLIRLGIGRILRGRVVWSLDDSPVVNASVRGLEESTIHLRSLNTAKPDRTGAFSLHGVPIHDLDVGIFFGSSARPDRTISAPQGVEDLGTIHLDGPTTIDVYVVDSLSAEPLQGAAVNSRVRTDASGRARLAGQHANSKVRIFCRCDGYLIDRGRDRICLTGKAGTTSEILVRMDRDPTWQEEGGRRLWGGYVRDERGAPIAAAAVYVSFDGSASLPAPGSDKVLNNRILFSRTSSRTGFGSTFLTDDTGRFEDRIPLIPGVHTYKSIGVIHRDYAPLWISCPELNGDVTAAPTLVLKDIQAWIPGLVTTESGEPLSGCIITCNVIMDPMFTTFIDERVSDRTGRFWIPYMPGTTLSGFVERTGYGPAHFKNSADEFYAGGTGELRVALEEPVPPAVEKSEPPRHPLNVRCLSSDGRPVKGVEVTAFAQQGNNISFDRGVGGPLDYTRGFTDADGRVRVESDSASVVPVRLALFREPRSISRSRIYYESVTQMQPGPQEWIATIRAGQVVEALVVFPKGRAPDSLDINELPTGSLVKLAGEGSRRRISLLKGLKTDDEQWYTVRKVTSWGRNLSAMAVSRYIPCGRYRLVVKVRGFQDYTFEPIEVTDADEVLPLIVNLVPADR